MTAIVWIRRSMRKYDNKALAKASQESDGIIPFYVVDDEYFKSQELGYPRVRFWRESLKELKQSFPNDQRLVVRKGKPIEQLEKLIDETDADKLYFNRDYTPYARERDSKARKLDVEVETFKDIVMFEKKEILTNDGDPYSVYSYYRDKWFKRDKDRPSEPEDFQTPRLESEDIPSLSELGFEKPEGMEWAWKAGREAGKQKLEDFKDHIWSYGDTRDLAAKDTTSRLSPHLKFGTVSIREAFWMAERLKARNPDRDTSGIETWQEELAWRDFYMQMLWNHPETVDEPFLKKYSSLEWKSREEMEERWNRWKNGKTGYPFVDAGMRQLKRTGWMHNRLRMVVTSFACKDLWLDWRDVHDYFSRMFVDAEIASMIGGIQWAYSIGTDAQPYFRVFNPVSQGERYDEKGEYVQEWVPELKDLPDQYIHKPWKTPETVKHDLEFELGEDYPKRIVDHSDQRERAISRFENAS